MAYSDGYQERQAGMSTGAKIAIALMLLIGLPIVAAMGYGIYSTFMISPDKRLERAIAGSPEAKGFVAAVKTRFQGEYSDMHEVAIRTIVEGGSDEAAQRVVLSHLRLFTQNHTSEVAAAPDSQLAAFLGAQVASAKVTTRHMEICRAGQTFVPERLPPLNDREEQVLEQVTVRFVEAAAAGRDHPVKRQEYAYSDQQALVGKMKDKGVSLAELNGLGGRANGDAAMKRKCVIAATMLGVLNDMPREQGLRIYAHLLRNQR